MHAGHDDGSAQAVFLFVIGIANPDRIWPRIAVTAIDPHAAWRAPNNNAAFGFAPSVPANETKVVNTPLVVILNTVPLPLLPPSEVVP